MNRTILAIITTAALLSYITGLSTEIIPAIEAKKGAGVYLSSSGHSSGVCGLVLCSEYPGGRSAYEAIWTVEHLYRDDPVVQPHEDDHKEQRHAPAMSYDDAEFQTQLDVFIHKFELGKMSAEDALTRITETHTRYVDAGAVSDIIRGVGERISLYESGTLDAGAAIESIHLTAEPQNVDPEFQAALDEVIHKFELGKMSAVDSMDAITDVHDAMVSIHITSDIIRGVGERISLYESGTLDAGAAIESIHLTAEPQNVDPEFQAALDEVIHKFELGKMSAVDSMDAITDVHDAMVSIHITSDIIRGVGERISLYESGTLDAAGAILSIHMAAEQRDEGSESLYVPHDLIKSIRAQTLRYAADAASADSVIGEIRHILEKAEKMAMAIHDTENAGTAADNLPPNTIDMPVGGGIIGCEKNNLCYVPTHFVVDVGTTVTWINSDGAIPHTVTAGNPAIDAESVGEDYPHGFDSGFISGGDSYEHTFDDPGLYDYYCQLHPWMVGTVTVV